MDKLQKAVLNANFAVEETPIEPVVEVPAPVEEALPVEEPAKKSSKKKVEKVVETVEDENREDNN